MQQVESGQPLSGLVVQDSHSMLDVSSLLRLSAAGDQLKEEEREGKGLPEHPVHTAAGEDQCATQVSHLVHANIPFSFWI